MNVILVPQMLASSGLRGGKRMRLKLGKALILFACLLGGQASAADLGGLSLSQCLGSRDSGLLSVAPAQSKQIVAQYFSEARLAMSAPEIIASRRPAYTWASGARVACGEALGYFAGGHVDAESIQKCDCFYQRYNSFR